MLQNTVTQLTVFVTGAPKDGGQGGEQKSYLKKGPQFFKFDENYKCTDPRSQPVLYV